MVELARKQADGNLGPWMMQEPRAAPGGHLNMREQQTHHMALPGVQHGYAHRKRRGEPRALALPPHEG